jgi:SRSO17 transposase
VQRQHCGTTGKLDNCVVTVHLGFVSDGFHALVDSDLFLPEESWAGDRDRCREARIPEEVTYRPKWRIALDLLERTLADGVRLKWVTADEAYGRGLEFREGVEGLGLLYVVEIPSNLTGWTRRPRLLAAWEGSQVRVPEQEARAVSKLWERGGPSWERWKVKETDKGPSVWEVRETPFHPSVRGYPGEDLRLVIAREVLSGELKYFLSNAPEEIPLGEVLHVAFSRWHIERVFEDGKGEVGLDHFEVRNYKPLMRHLILSMISFYFLADQTERLKEKKLELDRVPGESGGGMPVGSEPLAA